MSSRWDWLYDVRSVPLTDYVLDEVAKKLRDRLADWPVQVLEWNSEGDRIRFSPLVAPDSAPPDFYTFREAFRLASWELSREYEAIDSYMRREEWKNAGIGPDGYDLLVFLDRYLTEEMLAVLDVTEGRIGRRDLVRCLDKAEKLLLFSHVEIPAH